MGGNSIYLHDTYLNCADLYNTILLCIQIIVQSAKGYALEFINFEFSGTPKKLKGSNCEDMSVMHSSRLYMIG